LPPAQLLDILTQIKALATNDPARATELFQQAPQLAYAVFQALLLMNLVSPEAISAVIEQGGAPAPAPAPPAQQAHPMGYPAQPPPIAYQPAPGHGMTNTPPVGVQAYAPPPQAPQVAYGTPMAAPQAAQPAQNPDDLMAAVMNLPQSTIDQLPPAEREQIMKLRAEVRR
jgi:cleavage stimulation factor subunit 2